MGQVKKRILLVDDDRDFSHLITFCLRMHDYDITPAYTGEEGLEKAKEKPDIILLDIMLPKLNGYEVCKKLRQDVATRNIPVIMFTAKDKSKEKVEGLYIGADDYIPKSVGREELVARIEAVLRRYRPFSVSDIDNAAIITEIKRLLHEGLIVPHFQPIFYLQPQQLIGFEVLSRVPQDSYFKGPEMLFDMAFHVGMLFDLEMSCHQKALAKLGDQAKKTLTFLNVSPYLIQDSKFRMINYIYHPYVRPNMVTLELTERTAIKDFRILAEMMKFFRESGFKIAIDDVGSGYASLTSNVEVKPDFIKIDMHLVRDINDDPVKQNLIRAIILFCKQSKLTSIAEGVETEEEKETLISLGVDAAQGYYLGRPNPNFQQFL